MLAKGKARLSDYANSVRGAPFEWGTTDCACIVRDSLNALSGSRTFKQSWKTQRGARGAETRENGFNGALSGFCDVVHPRFIDAGDVAILEDTAAVYLGKTVFLMSDHEHGVQFIKMILDDDVLCFRLRSDG